MRQAAIFDMDGVLVNTELLHWQTEQQTLAKYGVNVPLEYMHQFAGTTAKAMFQKMITQYNLPVTFQEIYPDHEMRLIKLFSEKVELTPGVAAVINRLEMMAIPLALASSSTYPLIHSVLDRFALTTTFKVIVSGAEITHSKPAPDIFLETAARLGLAPADCVVFEDAVAGVRAARAAGMFCVGYENPVSTRVKLTEANLVIQNWRDLNLELIFSPS